ncbi:retrovirus-related Pol polyprotein from transposon 17.6 [Trichonephila clavipes]|nr:retrovirus-related Pol polyprotein from transposon 17.6 [Trichonephila clavipes]
MQENDIIEPSSSPWASPIVLVHLKSGYWQVEIHPEDREKTAFTSGQGLWQFKVMPFGLCNAPATFERLMETVLKGLTFEACLIYLDDVIIGGRTFEEHLQNIRKKVFVRTRKSVRRKIGNALKTSVSCEASWDYVLITESL